MVCAGFALTRFIGLYSKLCFNTPDRMTGWELHWKCHDVRSHSWGNLWFLTVSWHVTIVVSWHYRVTDWPTWCLGTSWGDYCWPDIRSLEVFPRLPRPRLGSRSWVRTHSRRYIKVQGWSSGGWRPTKRFKKKEEGFDLLTYCSCNFNFIFHRFEYCNLTPEK